MIALSDVLFALIGLLMVGYLPLASRMISLARQKPAIWALNLFAIIVAIIAGVVLTYFLAVVNSAAGYPVPQDVGRTLLRLFLVPLAAFPYLFYWVFRTGRFRDGTE